jgi:hypothetical protein
VLSSQPAVGELAWRIGVAVCTVAVATFVLVQLTAWPPHEDETLALFTGRGSVHDLIQTVLGERGGAPLHFFFAWAIAHTGGGLIALRLVSAAFGIASVPLIALLVRRLTDRVVSLVATALIAPSWMLLFHSVYGRMYSIFLFTATLSYIALLYALDGRTRRGWFLWCLAILACVATHPYGALVLASQGLYVLLTRRLRESWRAFAAVAIVAIPFWRTDLVLAGRFDVGVGGGGAKLGGPVSVLRYLSHVAGDFTVGWTVTIGLVIALAATGFAQLVRSRRSSAVLVACSVATPTLVFMLARVGSGLASPESRHLIFVLPFFATCLALPLVRVAQSRRRAALPVVAGVLLAIGVGEVAWGVHKTDTLYTGEPAARVQARESAASWLASTSRPDDVLFGYDPIFLAAWERNRDFSRTVVPRADVKLALTVLRLAHRPLGRGVWILDASDTNNFVPKLTIPLRYPTPARLFEVHAYGPFLVVRSRRPTGTTTTFLRQTRAVQFVGEDLFIGDSDINLLTVERALGMNGLDAAPGPR